MTTLTYLRRGFPDAFGEVYAWASKWSAGLLPLALGYFVLPGHPSFDVIRRLGDDVDMEEFDRRTRPDRHRRDPLTRRLAFLALCVAIVGYGVYARWLS